MRRLTALLPLALLACAPTPDAPETVAEEAVHHAAHVALPMMPSASEMRSGSVYQLAGEWRDQADRAAPLDALAGRPQVLAFVYTHCTFACPRIVARMKEIEGRVETDVGLVLVSIDPERDTPARLANYAETMHLDPARWTLLNGSDDQILELAVLLGVQYQATQGGDFAHTNALILLDGAGVPLLRLDGLESELTPLLAEVSALD